MPAASLAYRNLLRAARTTFKGDVKMLNTSHSLIRESFLENADLEPTSPEASTALQQAHTTATFLLRNVVQGVKTEDGDRYKLRIHEHTERGDNDTIKTPGTTLGGGGGKCCSS
ncbi:hypothetical protein F4803DRAFT_522605 [Xylaria telfairii]|nr:hypothetical protein F4803DRAFT_522605 [Xylaria telfairii]